MPKLIINGTGSEREVEQLGDVFTEFKASRRPRSRLDLRTQKDVDLVTGFGVFYDFIKSFARKGEKMPERGTREYNEYIDNIWKTEPILAGTIYGQVSKAQVKPWKITGGRQNANRAAKMLDNALFSFWKHGWFGFAGVSALDFYTNPLGCFWGANRRGNSQYGVLEALEHIDAHACRLTGSYTQPVIYDSPQNGQTITYKQGEILNLTSLTLSREKEMGAGVCAVERALRAAQILVALHEYEAEKLANLPPEGISTVSGLSMEEFTDAIAMWKTQRLADDSLLYPQVLFLLSQIPGSEVKVDMTPFSTLPDSLNRETVVLQYVNILANCFGISASDIWFLGGGAFGTGRESELQHIYAKGKGEGEWFAATEQTINRELPPETTFAYDTKDIEEDASAAATAKGWVDALLPLLEHSQTLGVSPEQWRAIFLEKGVFPSWLQEGEPNDRTIISSADVYQKESIEDIVEFVWSLGKLREPQVIQIAHRKELTLSQEHEGAMIAFMFYPKYPQYMDPLPVGSVETEEGDYHITLAYFPEISKEKEDSLLEYLSAFVKTESPVPFTLAETGVFQPGDEGKIPLFAKVEGEHIRAFRQRLVSGLSGYLREGQEWIPHMTLAYIPQNSTIPEYRGMNEDIEEWRIYYVRDGQRQIFPFEGSMIPASVEKEALPAIRGGPIPDGEALAGVRITRKTREAEQAIWRDIPELADFLEVPE